MSKNTTHKFACQVVIFKFPPLAFFYANDKNINKTNYLCND